MTKSISLQILEDIQDITDTALDFIEHEVGGNRFVDNWNKIKKFTDPVEKVRSWMIKIGATGNPEDVVKVIDGLADKGTRYLTPFTSPIPPDK